MQSVFVPDGDPQLCLPPGGDSKLTKVTGGPHASWGAKAAASDRVTGCPALTVTPQATALSE